MSIDWDRGLPVLTTADLMLREPVASDAASLYEALTDQQVSRFMSTPPGDPGGFERFIGWVRHERAQGRHFCYGVIPSGHATPVGLIQVREIEPGFGTAEWGFALARPHWGTGLFMAAASVVVDFAFRAAGVHRLEARASVQNGRGNGVLHKLGAEPEGVLRRSFYNAELLTDQVLWSIIAEDWQRSHPDVSYTTGRPEDPDGTDQVPVPRGALPWQDGLPVLRGEGIELRELQEQDGQPLNSYFRDEELGRYIPPPPTTPAAYSRFLAWADEHRRSGQFICYGMVPEGSSHAVGVFQVHRLDPMFRNAEWGFVLARPHWGTGLVTRGAEVLLDFLFLEVGVERLEARAMVANGRANGLLRKLGGTEEGHLRRSFLLGGQYHDDALWAILRSDWIARREGHDPPSSVL
ncbi:MAG: GNAT family protein [Acidobacteriota bacterium]